MCKAGTSTYLDSATLSVKLVKSTSYAIKGNNKGSGIYTVSISNWEYSDATTGCKVTVDIYVRLHDGSVGNIQTFEIIV